MSKHLQAYTVTAQYKRKAEKGEKQQDYGLIVIESYNVVATYFVNLKE